MSARPKVTKGIKIAIAGVTATLLFCFALLGYEKYRDLSDRSH
jgi:hypothetical protein